MWWVVCDDFGCVVEVFVLFGMFWLYECFELGELVCICYVDWVQICVCLLCDLWDGCWQIGSVDCVGDFDEVWFVCGVEDGGGFVINCIVVVVVVGVED